MRRNRQTRLLWLVVFLFIINYCKAGEDSKILEIRCEPARAMVKIDDNIVATKDGVATIVLSYGEHYYSVSAKNYHPVKDKIVIDGSQGRFVVEVTLNPAFGFLEIQQNTTNAGAKVFVDNTCLGTVPFKSDMLPSGSHNLRIVKERHQPFSEKVIISDGQTLTISPALKSDFAIVNVTTENNAEIWIDGKKYCNGGCEVELPEGEHIFETKLPNHKSQSISRNVSPGDEFALSIPAPVPLYGSLKVTSKPFKSDVYLDGKEAGKTPLFLQHVLTGKHQVTVRSDGMEDYGLEITIKEGEIEELQCTLKRKEIKLARVPADYEGQFVIADSITVISDSAFFGCSKITSVVIPSSVTRIGILSLAGCEALKTVKMSDNVEVIESGAFLKCSSLENINIPNSVWQIGKAVFAYCKSLTKVAIPPRVKLIEKYCFLECESLSVVTMNDSITEIGENAFFGCVALKSIRIPNSVKCIRKAAFGNCVGLTALQMGDYVDTLETYAFLRCVRIELMKLPATLRYIGKGALVGLPNVSISPDNKYYCIEDEVLYSMKQKVKEGVIRCNMTKAGKVVIPKGVSTIEMGAFLCCKLLTSVELPNSLRKIGAGAFEQCVSLTDIAIPATIDTIDNLTFMRCGSMKTITIPVTVKFVGENAFSSCQSLESIYIYNKDVVVKENAFLNCQALKSIFVPISSRSRFTEMLPDVQYLIHEMKQ